MRNLKHFEAMLRCQMHRNQLILLQSDSVSRKYLLKQVARPFITAEVIAERSQKLNCLQIYRPLWHLVELFNMKFSLDSYLMLLQTILPLVAMLRTSLLETCFEGLPRSCLDRTFRPLAFLLAAIVVVAGLRRTFQ